MFGVPGGGMQWYDHIKRSSSVDDFKDRLKTVNVQERWDTIFDAILSVGAVSFVQPLIEVIDDTRFLPLLLVGAFGPRHWMDPWVRREIVSILLDHCPRDELANSSVVWAAAVSGHASLIPLLLQHGASLENSPTDISPLCVAIFHNHLDSVRVLVEAGAELPAVRPICSDPIRLFLTVEFPARIQTCKMAVLTFMLFRLRFPWSLVDKNVMRTISEIVWASRRQEVREREKINKR